MSASFIEERMSQKTCPQCNEPMEFTKFITRPKLARWYCKNPFCDQIWVK